MRSRSVVTALLTLAAGATASVVARRLAARRRAAAPGTPPLIETPAPAVPAALTEAAADHDAVVLPFTRPAAPAPSQPTTPARCGDNGGRTKAGAPCGSRATSSGRCHHHRLAA